MSRFVCDAGRSQREGDIGADWNDEAGQGVRIKGWLGCDWNENPEEGPSHCGWLGSSLWSRVGLDAGQRAADASDYPRMGK